MDSPIAMLYRFLFVFPDIDIRAELRSLSPFLLLSLPPPNYVCMCTCVCVLARMHFAVTVGNEEVTRLDDGTVGGNPRLFCLSDDVIFSRLFLSARRSRDSLARVMLAWYHGQPDADVQDGTPSCRHADAVDAGSRHGNRIAYASHGVSSRDVPAITHGLAIASDALAWPANNSDNAAACALAQRRAIPRLHTAAVVRSCDGTASESSLAYGKSILAL